MHPEIWDHRPLPGASARLPDFGHCLTFAKIPDFGAHLGGPRALQGSDSSSFSQGLPLPWVSLWAPLGLLTLLPSAWLSSSRKLRPSHAAVLSAHLRQLLCLPVCIRSLAEGWRGLRLTIEADLVQLACQVRWSQPCLAGPCWGLDSLSFLSWIRAARSALLITQRRKHTTSPVLLVYDRSVFTTQLWICLHVYFLFVCFLAL